MLSGPLLKFCEGIAARMSGVAAHFSARPNVVYSSVEAVGWTCRRRSLDCALAQEKVGSAVVTLIEERIFLARIVRTQIAMQRKTPTCGKV